VHSDCFGAMSGASPNAGGRRKMLFFKDGDFKLNGHPYRHHLRVHLADRRRDAIASPMHGAGGQASARTLDDVGTEGAGGLLERGRSSGVSRFGYQKHGIFSVPGWQPITYEISARLLPEKIRPGYEALTFRESISECAHLVAKASAGNRFKVPWPVELAVTYGSKHLTHGQCTSAWMEVSPSELAAIVEVVKTKVLAFALAPSPQ
jgi:hypothetical protein